jgi:hypothetical protein
VREMILIGMLMLAPVKLKIEVARLDMIVMTVSIVLATSFEEIVATDTFEIHENVFLIYLKSGCINIQKNPNSINFRVLFFLSVYIGSEHE